MSASHVARAGQGLRRRGRLAGERRGGEERGDGAGAPPPPSRRSRCRTKTSLVCSTLAIAITSCGAKGGSWPSAALPPPEEELKPELATELELLLPAFAKQVFRLSTGKTTEVEDG